MDPCCTGVAIVGGLVFLGLLSDSKNASDTIIIAGPALTCLDEMEKAAHKIQRVAILNDAIAYYKWVLEKKSEEDKLLLMVPEDMETKCIELPHECKNPILPLGKDDARGWSRFSIKKDPPSIPYILANSVHQNTNEAVNASLLFYHGLWKNSHEGYKFLFAPKDEIPEGPVARLDVSGSVPQFVPVVNKKPSSPGPAANP